MRLGTLSLATSAPFMEVALLEGPMTLRVKYRYVDMDEAIALAKGLTLLAGFNAQTKITFDELRNPTGRLSRLFFDNDLLAMAAIAVAFQNQGTVLRGAIQHLNSSPKSHMEFTCLRNRVAYNPIVFEYLWRAMGRYTTDGKSPLTGLTNCPVENYINDYLTRDSVKTDAFIGLNRIAGFKEFDTDSNAVQAAASCWVFGPMWKKCTSLK